MLEFDRKQMSAIGELRPLYTAPPNPVTRSRIREHFDLGVRCINSLLTSPVVPDLMSATFGE